jgi:hypothetical protein
LQCYGPSEWVLLRLEIKQYHCSILKKSISYQFSVVSKHTATNLDTQPTTMRRSLTHYLKVPGCCCFNDTGIEILFRINISPLLTVTGLCGRDLCLGLPRLLDLTPMDFFLWGHIYTLPVDSEDLIAHIIERAAP